MNVSLGREPNGPNKVHAAIDNPKDTRAFLNETQSTEDVQMSGLTLIVSLAHLLMLPPSSIEVRAFPQGDMRKRLLLRSNRSISRLLRSSWVDICGVTSRVMIRGTSKPSYNYP